MVFFGSALIFAILSSPIQAFGRDFSLLSSVRGHCLFVETVSSVISNHFTNVSVCSRRCFHNGQLPFETLPSLMLVTSQ